MVLKENKIFKHHPANTKTSQRRPKRRLRLVSNGSRDDLYLRYREDAFQETSQRPLPGDVLKTSKTSSRLFLVKAKDHLDTIYGFSIYVRFKLLTYYHCIIR